MIGKWHLGYQPEMLPNAQGFDYSFGHLVGCIDNYSHFYYWNGTNRHNLLRNNEEVFYDGHETSLHSFETCPQLRNFPQTILFAVILIGALASTIQGLFPPNSKVVGVKCSAAAFAIIFPIAVLPVKKI